MGRQDATDPSAGAAWMHACARALADSEALALGAVREGVLVQASAALTRLFGITPQDLPRPFGELVSESDRTRVTQGLASPAEVAIGFRGLRADGSLFEAQLAGGHAQLADGPAMAIAVVESSRERDARQLSYAALFDAGTGLPNRRLLLDRTEQALVAAGRGGQRVAVLVVATKAESAGARDAQFESARERETGARLRACLRDTDTLAALGEGRFGVLLPRLAGRSLAATPAARIAGALAEPLELSGARLAVDCSIGIASYPDDGDAPEALLEGALAASRSGEPVTYASAAAVTPRASPERITWQARYEVGIQVIDGQHRHLLDLINRIGEDLRQARETDALVEGLRELVRYTEHHFATEERLMDEIGATAQRHRAEHRRLVDGLMRLSLRLDPEGVREGSRFLQDWLFRHIDEVDRPFAALLRNHGIR